MLAEQVAGLLFMPVCLCPVRAGAPEVGIAALVSCPVWVLGAIARALEQLFVFVVLLFGVFLLLLFVFLVDSVSLCR